MLKKVELAFDKLFALDTLANEYTELEMEALLRPEWKLQIEGLAKSTISGIHSPNKARALMDLPSAKFGDEPAHAGAGRSSIGGGTGPGRADSAGQSGSAG